MYLKSLSFGIAAWKKNHLDEIKVWAVWSSEHLKKEISWIQYFNIENTPFWLFFCLFVCYFNSMFALNPYKMSQGKCINFIVE